MLGLLKPEFISTNGVYIGLAPKSYIVTQEDNGKQDVKKGAKGNFQLLDIQYLNIYPGVPHSTVLPVESFENALLQKGIKMVEMNSLMCNAQRQMTRVKFEKVGLSDVSLKLFVHSDKVSCTPFMENGKYI